jgi:hypothetical protein
MFLWVVAALAVVGALAIVWGCGCWLAAGYSSEPPGGRLLQATLIGPGPRER